MTIMHIVLFRFKAGVTEELKETFLREARAMKSEPCIKNGRLYVGGPSLTDPIKYSKGFEHAFISYHEDIAALDEYQVKKLEHWHKVTSTYELPFDFDEDVCRFDFEIAEENQEGALPSVVKTILGGGVSVNEESE